MRSALLLAAAASVALALVVVAERRSRPETVPPIFASILDASPGSPPDLAACAAGLSLYHVSSLRSLVIEAGRLRLAWNTPSSDPMRVPQQSRAAYDRHEAECDLTEDDRRLLEEWLRVYAPFTLEAPDARRQPATRGVAFGERLRIECGSMTHELGWSGDSLWSDRLARERLVRALGELDALARDLTGAR